MTDELENVIAAGFASVSFAVITTFPAEGISGFVQLLAVVVPALALYMNRLDRREKSADPELATDGGDRS